MTTIKTAYHSRPRTGAGIITAKSRGKQRTVPYDHSKSPQENHGAAAGVLAAALGIDGPTKTTVILHMDNGSAEFRL